MDFKHTASKLKFEIGQLATEEGNAFYSGVYIQKITLKNVYLSGKLNLMTGEYEKDTPTGDRVFYDRGAAGTQIPVSIAPHRFEREVLIFPREADDLQGLITVEVVLGNSSGSNWRTLLCPLEFAKIDANGLPVTDVNGDQVYENYDFQPNYQYVLTLMLIDKTVQLVVFSPQVYEWMDVDADETETQSYLGKPITFAGLMWMDRNLGAQSADCYNDWDNTRGYYYQFGRSIPYMLSESKWSHGSTADWTDIYTIDQNGDRVWGNTSYLTIANWGENQIVYTPGESPQGPIAGYTGYELISTSRSGVMHVLTLDWTKPLTYWDNVENHPCPKGWRIPTAKDYASFMPDPRITGGIENMTTVLLDRVNELDSGIEDVIIGKISNVLSIYILKDKGTDKSYRIRIRRLNSVEGAGKQYFEINRYPADKSSGFDGMTISDIETHFDWNIPSEQILISATGFLNPQTNNPIYGEGIMVVLRTADLAPTFYPTFSYTCYLRTEAGSFGLNDSHNHACADQIRCVRDLN